MVQWITSKYPGVRYRLAAKKLKGGQPDKYFTIRYRINGKRFEEPVGWASEGWSAEKAYAVLAKIKQNIRLGTGPQSLEEQRRKGEKEREEREKSKARQIVQQMPLAQFAEGHFVPYIQTKKRSWKTDVQRLDKIILPVLGAYPLSAITTEDIQSLLDRLAASGAAPATIRHYFAILRRIFNIASQITVHGVQVFTGRNPAKGVLVPPVHNSRERYLSPEEADLLIAEAGKLRSPDLQHVIILSLNTGLRMSEIARLRWADVNIKDAILTVRAEARRKPGGHVPLNVDALRVFTFRSKQYSAKNNNFVFPPILGAKPRNFSKAFAGLVKKTDLNKGVNDRRDKIVFHSLRHTFASWLALAGTDIYRINRLMRHKTLSMTMRYAHLIPDATRDAVNHLRPPTL